MKLTLQVDEQIIEVTLAKSRSGYQLAQATENADVVILSQEGGRLLLLVNQQPREIFFETTTPARSPQLRLHYRGKTSIAQRLHATPSSLQSGGGEEAKRQQSGLVRSIMPGKIVETMVKIG